MTSSSTRTSHSCNGSIPNSGVPGSNEPGSFANGRPSRSFPSTTASGFPTIAPDFQDSIWPIRPRSTLRIVAPTTASASAIRSPRSSPMTSDPKPSATDGGLTMTPERTPRLEIENIVSTYEERGQRLIALDGLSLTVGETEFVALVGPSGSGKSTLLDIVAGLMTQDSGTVRLNGELTTAGQRLGRSAYMQQRDLLLPWRTTTGNAALGLEASGMSRSDAEQMAVAELWRFGLDGFGDAYRLSFRAACASVRHSYARSYRASISSCLTN